MDADLDALQTEYQGPGGVFEVLETMDGEIIGCYGLFVINEKYCELRKMYLRPDSRGKGFGKALLIRALNMAKKLEFSELRLETASCLVEAISLYRSFGFEPLPGKQVVERCDLAFRYNLAKWHEQKPFTDRIPDIGIKG